MNIRILPLARSLRLTAFIAAAAPLIGTTAAGAQTFTYSTLMNFGPPNGTLPTGDIVLDSAGDIYGVTQGGGTNPQFGTIYEITAGTDAFKTLVDFNSTTEGSDGGLTFDSNGDLFGSTFAGGAGNAGTVFEMAAGTTMIQTVSSFGASKTSGTGGYGNFVTDGKGDLIGTSAGGGNLALNSGNGDGTVYMIANTGTLANPVYSTSATAMVTFVGANGEYPTAGLVMDSRGNLYGTTIYGGDQTMGGGFGDGTVYKITNTGTLANPVYSSTVTALTTFEGANGANPSAKLSIDAKGNLYGTTANGGDLTKNNGSGDGTAFEIANTGTAANPTYGSLTNLVTFDGANGREPLGGLTLDSSGDLFGDTDLGGDLSTNSGFGSGSVFEIANSGTSAAPNYSGGLTDLFNFNKADGIGATASLTLDASGNIYGTTTNGGTDPDAAGTVFELTRGASGAASAPEPTSLALAAGAALGVAGTVLRRRRHAG